MNKLKIMVDKIKNNKVNLFSLMFLMLIAIINISVINQLSGEFLEFVGGFDFSDPVQLFLFPFIIFGQIFAFFILMLAVLSANVGIFVLITLISILVKNGIYSFNIDEKLKGELFTLSEVFILAGLVSLLGQLIGLIIISEISFFAILLFANIFSMLFNILFHSLTQKIIYIVIRKNPDKWKDSKPKRLIWVIASPFILYVVVTFLYNIYRFVIR